MYASRNIRLCNKDCICLFVCPTGATDTEDGQIDRRTCIDGCRLCVDTCPSHAINLVVQSYAEPAPKETALAASMMALCERKVHEERIAMGVAASPATPGAARLARAMARSARILAEDCAREAGYMIPQCRATRDLLAEVATEYADEAASIAGELATV